MKVEIEYSVMSVLRTYWEYKEGRRELGLPELYRMRKALRNLEYSCYHHKRCYKQHEASCREGFFDLNSRIAEIEKEKHCRSKKKKDAKLRKKKKISYVVQ